MYLTQLTIKQALSVDDTLDGGYGDTGCWWRELGSETD